MGASTVKNFKFIIESNQTQDCPIAVADIERAEETHGKDISHTKGKTAPQNPTTKENAIMTTPKELRERNEEIALCIDMMCINKIGFMTSISHPLCYRGCTHVPQNNKMTFHAVLDKML